VAKGADTPETVAELSGISLGNLRRRLPAAFNFDLITSGAQFDLSERGKKFLLYAQTCADPHLTKQIACLNLDSDGQILLD
jgi:hypothetical protein